MATKCKCDCGCMLLTEQCVVEKSGLTFQSKVLLNHAHLIDEVHDIHLSAVLGQNCMTEMCEAVSEALVAAEENETTWQEEISDTWLTILNNKYFQKWYAYLVEYVITADLGSGQLTADGLAEFDRAGQDSSQVSRPVSSVKLQMKLNRILSRAKTYQAKFMELIECGQIKLNCFECNPCEEYSPPGMTLGFGKNPNEFPQDKNYYK